MKEQRTTTVDAEEIIRFTRIAGEWWDPAGKFKPLHAINPLRIQWICDQLGGALSGKTILDIGCGGGLIAEPLAAMGAHVTGIDAGEKNIAVAKLHAEQSKINVDYRCTTAEDLAATGTQYDVVLALEIIEHVADISLFVKASAQLIKPGGILIYSTLNRTAKSYAMAIVGAEYILRWLPVGTHDWNKFLRPSELHAQLRANAIEVTSMTGMVMQPLSGKWRLSPHDLSVNYLMAGKKL